MTTAEIIMAVIGSLGFLLGLRAYSRDKGVQKRLLAIEEETHAWRREEREAIEAERRALEEETKTADFGVKTRPVDLAASQVIAQNRGPAEAFDVALEIWGERDGSRLDAPIFAANSQLQADRLRPAETVHAHLIFGIGQPSRNELRYRLSWTDGRGPQDEEGRVPL